MNWFKKLFSDQKSINNTKHISKIITPLVTKNSQGNVNGLHFTKSVEIINNLKKDNKNEEAIKLLLKCVDATEAESNDKGWGVAPWYYEQLAIIYRKQKLYNKEVEILERYDNQEKAPGVGPTKLSDRLMKAREMMKKYV